MPIGSYDFRVSAAGFQEFRRQPVTLNANQNVRIDAALTLSGTAESITIKAEGELVDSRSAVMGTPIDDRRLTELPINGPKAIALAMLLPGASGRQRTADVHRRPQRSDRIHVRERDRITTFFFSTARIIKPSFPYGVGLSSSRCFAGSESIAPAVSTPSTATMPAVFST